MEREQEQKPEGGIERYVETGGAKEGKKGDAGIRRE